MNGRAIVNEDSLQIQFITKLHLYRRQFRSIEWQTVWESFDPFRNQHCARRRERFWNSPLTPGSFCCYKPKALILLWRQQNQREENELSMVQDLQTAMEMAWRSPPASGSFYCYELKALIIS